MKTPLVLALVLPLLPSCMPKEPACQKVPYEVENMGRQLSKQQETLLQEMETALNKRLQERPPFRPFPEHLYISGILTMGDLVVYELAKEGGSYSLSDVAPVFMNSLLVTLDRKGHLHWLNRAASAGSLPYPLEKWEQLGMGPELLATKEQLSSFNHMLKGMPRPWQQAKTKRDIALLWTTVLYHDFQYDYPCIILTNDDMILQTEAWREATNFERRLMTREGRENTIRLLTLTYFRKRYAVIEVIFGKTPLDVIGARFQYQFNMEDVSIGDGKKS